MPVKVLKKYCNIIFLLLMAFPHLVYSETIPWIAWKQKEHNPKVEEYLGLNFVPEERSYSSGQQLEYYTATGGKNEKFYYEWVAFVDSGEVVFQKQGRFVGAGFSRNGKTMFAVTFEQYHIVYYYYREGKLGVIRAPNDVKVEPEELYFYTHTFFAIDDEATWVVDGLADDGFLTRLRRCDAFENCYQSDFGIVDFAFFSNNGFVELEMDEVIVYQDNTEIKRIDLNQEIKWRQKYGGSLRVFDNTIVVKRREQIAFFDLDSGLFVWQFDRKGLETKVKRLHEMYIHNGYLRIPFKDESGFFQRKLSWR